MAAFVQEAELVLFRSPVVIKHGGEPMVLEVVGQGRKQKFNHFSLGK